MSKLKAADIIFWFITILVILLAVLTSCTKEPVKSEVQPRVGIRITTEYIDGHTENSPVVF